MNLDKSYLRRRGYGWRDEAEVPAHRKRSKTASTSNSQKRSAHKYSYQKVLLYYGASTFTWGRQCEICGRIDSAGRTPVGWEWALPSEGAGRYGSQGESCLAKISREYPMYPLLTLEKAGWREWMETDKEGEVP